MSDELKSCYKCNESKKEVIQLSDTGDSGHVEWEAWRSCDCSDVSHGKTREEAIRIYNTREIEDIKDARIAELEQQIEILGGKLKTEREHQDNLEQKLAKARKANLRQRVEDICAGNDDYEMTVDEITDWLIKQGVEGDRP